MRRLLHSALVLALTALLLFAIPALADEGEDEGSATGFNAALTVEEVSSTTITVTVDDSDENNAILAEQVPTLTIPCTFARVRVTDPDGNTVTATLDAANGTVSFPVHVGGTYTVHAVSALSGGGSGSGTASSAPVEEVPFVDVPAGKYFTEPVAWAVGSGITDGTDATHFSPYASCTRGQLVTFLWRAAGEPEAKTAANPFSDVKETSAFYKAILWASENNIVGGYADGTFRPSQAVTRANAAAILFRFAAANGMDAVTLQELVSGYADASGVPAYAIPAFNWALATGVITGNNGSLLPQDTCTRAQIVTMLYRLLAK